MLSYLVEKIWIGIDYFLLNFIATFGSVVGLQVTAGPQVNSGLQPPTRWEPFVAGTMLRRPEPTKETVEPMNLSISVWHGDAGDAVASPMLKNWPLFGQTFQ